ncbi:Transposase [Ensifer adhaerens]|nr:Transposase [Ensifer adhaerens]
MRGPENEAQPFTDEQIIGILKEREAGTPVSELRRKHGISDATFYKYKAKHGGMDVSEGQRPKDRWRSNIHRLRTGVNRAFRRRHEEIA